MAEGGQVNTLDPLGEQAVSDSDAASRRLNRSITENGTLDGDEDGEAERWCRQQLDRGTSLRHLIQPHIWYLCEKATTFKKLVAFLYSRYALKDEQFDDLNSQGQQTNYQKLLVLYPTLIKNHEIFDRVIVGQVLISAWVQCGERHLILYIRQQHNAPPSIANPTRQPPNNLSLVQFGHNFHDSFEERREQNEKSLMRPSNAVRPPSPQNEFRTPNLQDKQQPGELMELLEVQNGTTPEELTLQPWQWFHKRTRCKWNSCALAVLVFTITFFIVLLVAIGSHFTPNKDSMEPVMTNVSQTSSKPDLNHQNMLSDTQPSITNDMAVTTAPEQGFRNLKDVDGNNNNNNNDLVDFLHYAVSSESPKMYDGTVPTTYASVIRYDMTEDFTSRDQTYKSNDVNENDKSSDLMITSLTSLENLDKIATKREVTIKLRSEDLANGTQRFYNTSMRSMPAVKKVNIIGPMSRKWLQYFLKLFDHTQELVLDVSWLCETTPNLGDHQRQSPLAPRRGLTLSNLHSFRILYCCPCPTSPIVSWIFEWTMPQLTSFSICDSDIGTPTVFGPIRKFLIKHKETLTHVLLRRSYLCSDCLYTDIKFKRLKAFEL